MHLLSLRRAAAIAVTGGALMAWHGLPESAAVQDKLLLGGGAAILLHDDALCTLTTIGYDNGGRLVGFTAAHCGGVGSPVLVEGAEDHGSVGTVVAAEDGLDYAVIEFDPLLVASIADYEGFGIFGIESVDPEPAEPAGPEAPADAEPGPEHGAGHHADPGPEHDAQPGPELGAVRHACKLGRGSGLQCFDIGPAGVELADEPWWLPGDDGAPVTVDNLLVGMVRDGTVPAGPLTEPGPGIVLFSAILDDVDAKGGPGAGFGRRS
ncbi:serine protease [Mycobacterium sp. UM_Kg1]|uniref:serine protease n=1 Tax=Mycobacterium sp. UM_Kg1 TaxID=1545691 RepID=UPI00128CB22A|nr:serine protease [Mycobacterium sp. UM_Kg1]